MAFSGMDKDERQASRTDFWKGVDWKKNCTRVKDVFEVSVRPREQGRGFNNHMYFINATLCIQLSPHAPYRLVARMAGPSRVTRTHIAEAFSYNCPPGVLVHNPRP
eukprot:scaffold55420_cov62-Phaeocystis_antarctica.AAC.5